MKKQHHQYLAALVYEFALRKQVEKEVEAKYSKRIEYLVGANNELMNELEQCEEENATLKFLSPLNMEEE